MAMVQLDCCRVMFRKVYCKALFAQNKCFITLAVCPGNPLTLESVQVLLLCIVDESKHCLIPLPCVKCHGTDQIQYGRCHISMIDGSFLILFSVCVAGTIHCFSPHVW